MHSGAGMILITGAGGKTGRAVLNALVKRGSTVRVLVHRPEQADAMRALGAAEVLAGDLHDPQVIKEAFHGIEQVYHICPNMEPAEVWIAEMAIQAAVSAGVSRFVYHSVLHPQVEEMPHHWNKMRVEERLFKSGLAYTILQPAAYMQNLLPQWQNMAQNGIYAVPYAASTRLGMVDLEDVAGAAAVVMTVPGHAGAIYELAGGEVLTQTEVAEIAGRLLGRAVRVEQVPLGRWEQASRSAGLPDTAIATLLQMFRYYERYGFWGNPSVLSGLLGRRPASFEDFIARSLRDRSFIQPV